MGTPTLVCVRSCPNLVLQLVGPLGAWLAETLKKGSPFRPDSETNEPPLRTYQLWKKTFYEETHKLDDMTDLPKSQPKKTYEKDLESNLDKVGDEVENLSSQSTPQVLPSFEEYTPPVTYPKEIEETLGTPIEVEPLDQINLEDVGLTNHNISLSSREIPSVDEPEPQLLPKISPLDVNLGDKRGTDPPINPYSPGNFRLKVVDQLTIHIPPSTHVAYYHPGLGDPKKHYGFKPGLLVHGGSQSVDFSKLEMIEDDWELEFKEVSFLRRGLNLPVRPNELEKVEKAHLLEDKQIPSVGVFDEVIWEALEGYTHDLDSFGEETRQDCSFTTKWFQEFLIEPEDGCTNAYDKPIGNLDKVGDEVENPSPQSTPQVLPSFEEYTPPATYPEEIEETLGTPMKVEPLDQTKLEDVGLTNHTIFLSSREIPSVDEPKPQLLPKILPLDVNLGDKRGTDPPINPYSLGSFRLKMIEDDWELEFKEVSFLGRGLNLPVKPKEVEKVRIIDSHHLEKGLHSSIPWKINGRAVRLILNW
ncbi:hypothetical protein Tco_0969930 [Tanacetum coccineum]